MVCVAIAVGALAYRSAMGDPDRAPANPCKRCDGVDRDVDAADR